jgi:membrane protein
VLVHSLSERASVLPPREAWGFAVSLTCDLTVAAFVPWILLSGAVAPRLLLPGALIFALLMLPVRPASAAWLPRALEASADRYGPIGVAFTYVGWLYVVSFLFLATAAVGQVIATDRGRLGSWIRRGPSG